MDDRLAEALSHTDTVVVTESIPSIRRTPRSWTSSVGSSRRSGTPGRQLGGPHPDGMFSAALSWRDDDLVVRFPDGSWGTLTVAEVFEALSRRLAEQAMFDALTGLANRELLLAELT